MQSVATFSNPAEAGFVQSLLQDAGIQAYLPDAGSFPVGVYQIQIQVAEEDVDRAREIIQAYQASLPPPHPAIVSAHLSSGYPFLGITGFVAMVWALGVALLFCISALGENNLFARIGELAMVAIVSFVQGLFIGAFIALMGLICRPLWRKLGASTK